jgi:hypothetical protein
MILDYSLTFPTSCVLYRDIMLELIKYVPVVDCIILVLKWPLERTRCNKPAGKYTKAPFTVEERQLRPHRLPSRMARLIASVSSFLPFPTAP